MSTHDPSRKPPATFQDVLVSLDVLPALNQRQRQDLASALRSFCRMLGRSPAEIAADPESVRKLTAIALPSDVSNARWKNIRSLVSKALQVTGSVVAPRRAKNHVSPAWRDLLDAVPCRYERTRLSRLASYCSAAGIAPAQVNDQVVETFSTFVARTLVPRPKQVCREAVLAWNRVEASSTVGLSVRLRVPSHRRNLAQPLEAFSPSFVADAQAFVQRLQDGDPFGEDVRAASSPITVRNRALQLRQMASALVLSGRTVESVTCLASLVEATAAKAILGYFWKRNGERKTGQIHNYALLLLQIAKYWAKLPEAEINALSRLRKNIAPKVKGMTDRNRTRLRMFDDSKSVRLWLHAPIAIERQVNTRRPGYNDAVLMQSAIGLALLAQAPIRMKNLALLCTRHLVRTRPGVGAKIHLVIPEQEVKNSQALEFELPETVVRLLTLYRERFLPLLSTSQDGDLFPSRDGTPKTPGHLSVQLQRHLKQVTGLDMNMHLTRHLAAKLFLKAHPGDYETVRQLLGHKSLDTTVRIYCELKQSDAVRRYDAMLAQYRV